MVDVLRRELMTTTTMTMMQQQWRADADGVRVTCVGVKSHVVWQALRERDDDAPCDERRERTTTLG